MFSASSSGRTRPARLMVSRIVVLWSAVALANGNASAQSPEKLVESLTRNPQETKQTQDAAKRMQLERDRDNFCDMIAAYGDQSLPAIREALKSHPEQDAQIVMMQALSRIDTEEAARPQIEQIFANPYKQARDTALTRLIVYPAPMALSDEQLNVLVREVAESEIGVAANRSHALAHCVHNDIERRMRPILDRFTREVAEPSAAYPDMVPLRMSYLSPRVDLLNTFLRAFAMMGDEAAPYFRAEIETNQNEEVHKWLHMALGMTGDPSAVDALRTIIESDPSPYVRWEAVRPYAKSAGKEGLPFLETLLSDPTETEYEDCLRSGPYRLIAQVAASAIADLTGARPKLQPPREP